MYQDLFNIVIGLAGGGLGWWMANTWKEVKGLQARDIDLSERIASIEVLVAGNYVKKDELSTYMGRIFSKLDHIEAKVTDNALKAEAVAALVRNHDDRINAGGGR